MKIIGSIRMKILFIAIGMVSSLIVLMFNSQTFAPNNFHDVRVDPPAPVVIASYPVTACSGDVMISSSPFDSAARFCEDVAADRRQSTVVNSANASKQLLADAVNSRNPVAAVIGLVDNAQECLKNVKKLASEECKPYLEVRKDAITKLDSIANSGDGVAKFAEAQLILKALSDPNEAYPRPHQPATVLGIIDQETVFDSDEWLNRMTKLLNESAKLGYAPAIEQLQQADS